MIDCLLLTNYFIIFEINSQMVPWFSLNTLFKVHISFIYIRVYYRDNICTYT